jgi:hypothetical protein
MDRFDCQFLMATFVNVYISSFIRTASPQKLLALVSFRILGHRSHVTLVSSDIGPHTNLKFWSWDQNILNGQRMSTETVLTSILYRNSSQLVIAFRVCMRKSENGLCLR